MNTRASAFLLAALLVCATGGLPLRAAAQSAPPAGDVLSVGSLAYLNAAQQVVVNGQSTCTVSLAGTFVGTVTFEGTSDGVNWYAVSMTPYGGGASSSTASAAGLWFTQCAGLQAYRTRMTSWTSGAANVTLRSSMGVAFATGAQVNTANTFTQPQTFQAPTGQIIIGNGSTSQTLNYDGTWVNVPRLKITTQLSVGGNTAIAFAKIGSNTSCSGTSPVTSSSLNNINCLVTAVTSSAVLNFGTAYAARPICVVSDETTTTSEAKPTITTSSVTVATPGASDIVDIICLGNGGV